MCCFSGAVSAVANTNIFARLSSQGSQYLVYNMTFSASADLAMILPLPVPKNSIETAVRFISLAAYPNFFAELDRPFSPPPSRATRAIAASPQRAPLKVFSVGSFDASFVPTLNDFQRLDPHFSLPASVWRSLPGYQDYGFAVFKLKCGDVTVHPMAFEFPTIQPELLFFPTLHIHDGAIHAAASYDHSLYCQIGSDRNYLFQAWERATSLPASYMEIEAAQGIIEPESYCYKVGIHGTYRNQDCWI